MPLHQKMKAINPPVIYFGGFAVCATGVFSPAAAHARHAEEIVCIGSVGYVHVFPMFSSTRLYGSMKSTTAAGFSQQKLQITAVLCVLESIQALYFAAFPAKEAPGLSQISTGPRIVCLGSSLGPSGMGETGISQGHFHTTDEVMLPRLQTEVGLWEAGGGQENPPTGLWKGAWCSRLLDSRLLGSNAVRQQVSVTLSCGTLSWLSFARGQTSIGLNPYKLKYEVNKKNTGSYTKICTCDCGKFSCCKSRLEIGQVPSN